MSTASGLNVVRRASVPRMRGFRDRLLAVAGALAVTVAALGANAVDAKPDKGYGVEVISTRADRVSGGDALVQITYKHDNRNHPLQITLNGRDVSGVFRPGDDDNTLIGLVTGLGVGKNLLRVITPGFPDTLEMKRTGARWSTCRGEVVEIDFLMSDERQSHTLPANMTGCAAAASA